MATTTITAEPGLPFLVITREFNASPELLLRAHTEADLYAQWIGPRSLTTTVEQLDARHGGAYRFIQQDPEGNSYAFRGVFHGDPSVNGFTQTFEWEEMPGHVALETIRFERRGDRTLLRGETVFQSVEDRDGAVSSGMEQGVNEGYDKLDELIASLAAV